MGRGVEVEVGVAGNRRSFSGAEEKIGRAPEIVDRHACGVRSQPLGDDPLDGRLEPRPPRQAVGPREHRLARGRAPPIGSRTRGEDREVVVAAS